MPRSVLLRGRKVSGENCRKFKTNLVFKNLFKMSCRLRDKVEKRGKARQVTDDNITLRALALSGG